MTYLLSSTKLPDVNRKRITLTLLAVFTLLLSCQQRYRHVKKVKAHPKTEQTFQNVWRNTVKDTLQTAPESQRVCSGTDSIHRNLLASAKRVEHAVKECNKEPHVHSLLCSGSRNSAAPERFTSISQHDNKQLIPLWFLLLLIILIFLYKSFRKKKPGNKPKENPPPKKREPVQTKFNPWYSLHANLLWVSLWFALTFATTYLLLISSALFVFLIAPYWLVLTVVFVLLLIPTYWLARLIVQDSLREKREIRTFNMQFLGSVLGIPVLTLLMVYLLGPMGAILPFIIFLLSAIWLLTFILFKK